MAIIQRYLIGKSISMYHIRLINDFKFLATHLSRDKF
jgi:hypothetical protein